MTDALLFREHETEQLDDWVEHVGELGGSNLLWVDLENPTEDEVRGLAEALELDGKSVDRLLGKERTPFLADFDSYLHVTMYAPCGEERELERVAALVSESWIVTVRDGSVDVVEELRERAEGGGDVGRLQGVDFLADLVTWVLEGYLRAFEEVDVALEELDDRALRERASPDDSLRHLVRSRAQIGRLRRQLVAHRKVLLALTRPELGGISTEESAERFASLLTRLEEVVQAARDSRESVLGSFELLMTQVSRRTNDIMKTLTLVSILLLPGTLIVGALGMNFKVGLFEHPWLFYVALAVIASVAAVTLVVVKARRWI